METQSSKEWFEIAQKVNDLLQLSNAKEHFREQTRNALADWGRRVDEVQQREKLRSEKARELGEPFGSPIPDEPKEGYFLWVEGQRGNNPPVQAFLPVELSPDRDPDDSPFLPLSRRVILMAERYAVLSAVWDAYWKGEEKLNPWTDEPDSRDGYHFGLLVQKLTRCDPQFGVSEADAEFVRTWVAEVEADLRSLNDLIPTHENKDDQSSSYGGFLGGEELANALGVHPTQFNAFFQLLLRKRTSLGDDSWHEVSEPRPNSPRYHYRVDSAKVRDLAAKYKAPKADQ